MISVCERSAYRRITVYNMGEITQAINMNNELLEFAERYNSITATMKDLCLRAARLASYNRSQFMKYVVDCMGLSRSTATQLINAGQLYTANYKLLDMSYTKVVELQPVKEQLNEYFEDIGTDEDYAAEVLEKKTQKQIRQSVKEFLNKGRNQLTNLDGDEPETRGAPEEDPVEVVSIDCTVDYLEIKSTVEMIKAYLSEFTTQEGEGRIIEADDVRICKSIIGNLDLLMKRVRTIIKEGGMSFEDYYTEDEREVNFE